MAASDVSEGLARLGLSVTDMWTVSKKKFRLTKVSEDALPFP